MNYRTIAGIKESKYQLDKYERELNKPINWGEITYNHIKQRIHEIKSKDNVMNVNDNNDITDDRAGSFDGGKGSSNSDGNGNGNEYNRISSSNIISKKVREMIELNLCITGPLDGSNIINILNNEEQIEFFSKYNKLQYLILQKYNNNNISCNVLREISITCGNNLIELDLSYSLIKPTHLEILFVQTIQLASLKLNNCQMLDTPCTMKITGLLSSSLVDLYVNGCSQYKTEPLQWIGGTIGLNDMPHLHKLKTIDLGMIDSDDVYYLLSSLSVIIIN